MRRRVVFIMSALSALGLTLAVGATIGSARSKAVSDKSSSSIATNQTGSSLRRDIREIKLEPASLTLRDGRDARKVLVLGTTAAKTRYDLTSVATFKADSTTIEIDSQGYIQAKSNGQASVTISAAGKQIKLPIKVESAAIPEIRFVRDVEPILSQVGCNAGTCHGSAKGKNGFKLSLRGYDPDFDYQALVNDLSGRRINRVAVDESLMLLKPTGEVPHEGRQAIKPGSREYQILRQWIVEGAKFEEPAAARANRVEVLPAEVNLSLPSETQQILVIAHYPDGTSHDVTREAVVTSNNPEVTGITNGVVTAIRRGEAAILVRYEGNYATREVTVMGDRTGYKWANVPDYNYIDAHVNAKLKRMKILPSDLCTDAEFIRRVSLDLTGVPPSLEKVQSFLEDSTPSKAKREKLVDELIGSKNFIECWANKWADLLQCNGAILGEKGVWVYRNWIRQAIADNQPYDQFVRDLLLARGSAYVNPAVNYYRVLREPGKIAEDVSQTFLGTRFNCNKCHDHPFEKWTQNQYYQFGAYFARVAIKNGGLPGDEVVYLNYSGGEVKHPKTEMDVAPQVPYGEAKPKSAEEDRREAFVAWLTSRDNPFFAKSYANRAWSYFFGRGIIEPVDDIRGSNPPSNPALLDALTDDFIKNSFNAQKLMRTICLSRTYQLSFVPNRWNDDDRINFSHNLPRRLSAEQLMDAVAVATGAKQKLASLPAGMRAAEVADGMVAGNDFLALFGRPSRKSACECERSSSLSLSHALNLINGATVGEALADPDNRIKKIVDTEKDNGKVVESIYLAIMNRNTTSQEIAAVQFPEDGKRLEVAQDLAWALFNSPAFLFNR